MPADRDEIEEIARRMTALRHRLHAQPEIGWEEVATSRLVAGQLQEIGVDAIEPIARTGLVATIRGSGDGTRVIGLRSDMDALPIKELNDLPYRSAQEGVMHACGHDGHMAMLLGAAALLARRRDFDGTVHLIFQPAEEGRGGARRLVEEGLFERFPCDAIYGMHNFPGLAAGRFGIRTGAFMAGVNRWWVTFHAAGGHGGGGHHKSADLAVVQAQFILALQTIVSRNTPATETCVVSVGHIDAGSYWSGSIMPSRLTVAGTARSFSKAVSELIERRIPELAHGLAALNGCRCEVEMRWLAPPLINAEAPAARLAEAARLTVGAPNVDPQYPPTTAGEDFAEMLSAVPGALIFIGNGTDSHELHTPQYDFNDSVISTGIAFWRNVVHVEMPQSRQTGRPDISTSPENISFQNRVSP